VFADPAPSQEGEPSKDCTKRFEQGELRIRVPVSVIIKEEEVVYPVRDCGVRKRRLGREAFDFVISKTGDGKVGSVIKAWEGHCALGRVRVRAKANNFGEAEAFRGEVYKKAMMF